jgi:Protein of unknown function (DUF4239)
MLSLVQDLLVLICTIAASLGFMVVLNRISPLEKRNVQNDLIGWQLNMLGTTYAVILGFMLYTVWTNFGAADLNADLEASALRNVYRLAGGLPPSQRAQLETEAKSYADAAVNRDWPEMANGQIPEETHKINEAMWTTVMSVKPAAPSEIVAEDHALTELSTLTMHRRTRLLQSVDKLPVILWCVLFVGGILTIVSVAMFGSSNFRFHTLQVFSLTLLITLAMLAIADINEPFRGWVCVSTYAFERAQENMRHE